MESLGLLDAVGRWGAGQSLGGFALWGVPIPWLGRVGICLLVLGGLAVVLDLVGAVRLEQWARDATPDGGAARARLVRAVRAALSWRVLPQRYAARAERRWRAARRFRAGALCHERYVEIVERNAPTVGELGLVLLGAAVRIAGAALAHQSLEGASWPSWRVVAPLAVLVWGPVGGALVLWQLVSTACERGLRGVTSLAARALTAGEGTTGAWRCAAVSSLLLGFALTLLAS
ncbi:hypothetical protein [Streptoalloteichus hindustanus]|uniref:Uncharacterized protein n=1 Tax=Streptoalloteichus hindustanus TaxID=2017 RepID=A0A1M5LP59_STRHI|nr:hypothetical protein [Streptoalloteichus hindustanus]SHG66877.1 hypothetical protein SAMN05444320_11210 [Streptoalloteichus hindustanus]